jgi:hypothetical protein
MNMEEKKQEVTENICKVFKLSNGESIICIVSKETPSYVEIQIPFRLHVLYNPQGTINLAMFRWDHTIDYDQPIRIYKSSIVAIGEPTEDMFMNYSDMIKAISNNKEESENDPSTEENDQSGFDKLMVDMLSNFKSNKLH